VAGLGKTVVFTFNNEDANVTPRIHVTFMKQLPTILAREVLTAFLKMQRQKEEMHPENPIPPTRQN
jgi:hypothetical protein